ncbi:unnamed protein product [Mycena citricolor]|uniref:3'-5' exonuclease n=1 Tax=Mycena citricolor TaxID=2018698 RepID=A0AAD2K5C1_9AGAR|nr:unnamed protein product [Mycena citricolor]CAK5280090.1 unnamed protein product [Mycena citricolor]
MAAERASALSDPDKDVPVPTGPPPPTIKFSWRNTVPCPRRVYITDTAQAEIEMSIFQGPCGLDIEWKPTFVKGGAENPNLKTFLEDPLIVKAGVGIQGDATKMFRDYRVDIRGCVDLSYLARTVDNARWKGSYSQPIGLARLIATYEDRLLVKGKITRSNWERNQLSVEQQEYAANGGSRPRSTASPRLRIR